MSSPLRIGVVGAGAVAQVAHLNVLTKLPGAEIVAICDIDVPKARSLASRFMIADVYDDIEDLLRYAKPDAVVVCTPNHLHEVHVATALSLGVHVLCERPLGLSSAGVERLVEAQQRAGPVLMVGFNHRYRNDVQAVRRFLSGGELGTLHAIRCGWYAFRPSRQALGWRRRRDQAGGGAMLDLGLPLIDLALWLTDTPAPTRVSAHLVQYESGIGVDDAGSTLIRCDGDMSIVVDVSWHHVGDRERFWFELMGTEGSAQISPLRVFKEMHGAPMNVTPTGASGRENAFNASYRAEWAIFLAAVRGQVEAPSLEDQVLLHKTLEAVQRSANEGHDVPL